MASRSSSLPSRFPIGTKFVIESQPRRDGETQVFKRHLEFPDGTYLRLPTHTKGVRTTKNKSSHKSRTRH